LQQWHDYLYVVEMDQVYGCPHQNMGDNQSITTQHLFLSFRPRPYEQLSSTKEQGRENKVNNQ
jgi:hypothetical protein